MTNFSLSRRLGVIALAAAGACHGAQAADAWVSTHTLRHDVGDAVAGAAVQPGQRVHVAVTLRVRHQADLDVLTARLVAGQPQRHLGRDEILAQYAPTAAQVQAVVDHLRRAGFADVKVAPNRLLVSANGTAATVKAAFNTELRGFDVNGRAAFANVSDAQVPAALAGIVNGVHGLQTVTLPHTTLKIAAPDAIDPPRRTTPGMIDPPGHVVDALAEPATAKAAPVAHDPTDFPGIYDASSLPPATNATIGIISAGDITQTLSDLAAFATKHNFAQPAVDTVVVGDPGFETSGVVEWNLDSQSSLSAAGGAVKKMVFYVGTSLDDASLTEAYNQAVSDDVAQAINVSIGECETGAASSGLEASDDAIFQLAVAQGQTFSISTGDSGSFECTNKKTSGQSYPAVSPWVIALGGTEVKTVGTTTWASESVWACASALSCNRDAAGGAGGGISATEPAPAWQAKSGVLGASTWRGVPDISFDASPRSGALVMLGDQVGRVGGTSLAAPLFTGFWARLQSKHDNALVFPAAAIYQYGPVAANAAAMFHDVTIGKNGAYKAGSGWDYASGFGSLDIGKFSAFIDGHPGF